MKVNATSFGLARSAEAESEDAFEFRQWDDTLIAALADGIGSARAGREAAAKVVRSLVNNFKVRPRAWSVHKALEEITRHLNRLLFQESHARHESAEMLATLAAVVLHGQKLHGLNVGDSRVYRLRDGVLTQLSTDHRVEGMTHVLARAMGMEEEVCPQHFESDLHAGDILLLCSDGVSDLLEIAEIKTLLANRASARTIVAAAREKATPETLDDASAIVLDVMEISRHSDPAQSNLVVIDALKAGDVIHGYSLLHAFTHDDRIWLATREAKRYVLKFPPRAARDNEAILNQFVKEMWHATQFQAEHFATASIPDEPTVHCYVQEFIAAPTLRQSLADGPLTVDEAIALARFLLAASQFLLRHDLIHADIKPENILVVRTANRMEFKLIDLGSISEIFAVTSRAGTPSYLAPERFAGGAVCELTEIFAIGVTVFEAVTRALPFGEIEPFQTPHFTTPRRPGKLNPNLPPWFESVLLRAISTDPERRYQDYSEMEYELNHPEKVAPYFRANASLVERNPVLFYKVGFFVLLAANLILLLKLLR